MITNDVIADRILTALADAPGPIGGLNLTNATGVLHRNMRPVLRELARARVIEVRRNRNSEVVYRLA